MLKKSKRLLLFTSLLLSALAVTGCDKIPGLGGGGSGGSQVQVVNGFAVVDLDLIASRLGQDKALQQALNQSATSLNDQLAQQRVNFQRRVLLEEQKLVEQEKETEQPRTLEQQQQLQALVQNLNATMAQSRAASQQQLSQQQVALIQQFRQKVRPIAISIARERGFSIVLTKNESVLFAYDEAFDISEEVIKRMATPLVP